MVRFNVLSCVFILLVYFLALLPNTYAQIVLTEIYPAPDGSDKEWVEVVNNGPVSIDLTGFGIFDLAGNLITIQQNSIAPGEYILAESTSIVNNSGDSIFLKDSSGSIIDSVSVPAGITSVESYVLCSGIWTKTNIITKGFVNNDSCNIPTLTLSPTITKMPHLEVMSSTPIPTTLPLTVTLTVLNTTTKTSMNTIETIKAEQVENSAADTLSTTPQRLNIDGNLPQQTTPQQENHHQSTVYSLTKRKSPPIFNSVKAGILLCVLSSGSSLLYSVHRYNKIL